MNNINAARNLVSWKPGQSGNPSGRPKIPEALRGIHSLTQPEVCKIISKYARMEKAELIGASENPKTSALELCIASIFVACIKTGDYTKLSFLLDRAIGKVPVIEETDEDKAARQEIQSLSNDELIRLVTEKLPELTAKKAE